MSKLQIFFPSGRTEGRQVVKSLVCIYIAGNLSEKHLNQPRLILQCGCMKSEQGPFFWFTGSTSRGIAQGRLSLSSSLLVSMVQNGKFARMKKRSPWSYMNHSEGHCPTLPLLSHLLYFLFKVSRESKPQQTVPSLAQVAYFYSAVNILTSPFSIDRWLSQNLLLQQSSLQI